MTLLSRLCLILSCSKICVIWGSIFFCKIKAFWPIAIPFLSGLILKSNSISAYLIFVNWGFALYWLNGSWLWISLVASFASGTACEAKICCDWPVSLGACSCLVWFETSLLLFSVTFESVCFFSTFLSLCYGYLEVRHQIVLW